MTEGNDNGNKNKNNTRKQQRAERTRNSFVGAFKTEELAGKS
jgi:hypothetical protein